MSSPQKIKACSFLPGATRIIQDMGLEEYLYGVTFECPSDKPKVVRSVIEDNEMMSEEIDEFVSRSKQMGKNLYYIDEDLLQEISPDIIFTQDVCDVCQIDTSTVQRAIYKLKKQPKVIPLIPRSLDDVFDNVLTIADSLGKKESGYKLLTNLNRRTHKIIDTLRKSNAPLKRVMVMEWISPIYNCGHWIPYQVSQAGGVDMLGNPSGYSIVTPWEKVLRYNPEVLIISPCGFNLERAKKEVEKITNQKGFDTLSAAKNNAVYLADADYFTCPSAQLVDGIELFASLFHPKLFTMEERFKDKYLHIKT